MPASSIQAVLARASEAAGASERARPLWRDIASRPWLSWYFTLMENPGTWREALERCAGESDPYLQAMRVAAGGK